MSRILFIGMTYPPDRFNDLLRFPLATAPSMLANMMRKRGHEVGVWDRGLDISRPLLHTWDAICISVATSESLSFAIELIKDIPPGPLVLVGGRATLAPTNFSKLSLVPRIDHIVAGDGTKALVKIVEGGETSRVILGRKAVRNELVIGWVPVGVLKVWGKWTQVPISVDSFCKWRKCAFCIANKGGVRVVNNKDSVEKGVKEFTELYDKGSVILNVIDNAADYERVSELLPAMQHASITTMLVRIQSNWMEFLDRMRGMEKKTVLRVGAEFADDRVLQSMNKGTSLKQIMSFMQEARKRGFFVYPFLMLNPPSTTPSQQRASLRAFEDVCDAAAVCDVWIPEGTKWWKEGKRKTARGALAWSESWQEDKNASGRRELERRLAWTG